MHEGVDSRGVSWAPITRHRRRGRAGRQLKGGYGNWIEIEHEPGASAPELATYTATSPASRRDRAGAPGQAGRRDRLRQLHRPLDRAASSFRDPREWAADQPDEQQGRCAASSRAATSCCSSRSKLALNEGPHLQGRERRRARLLTASAWWSEAGHQASSHASDPYAGPICRR